MDVSTLTNPYDYANPVRASDLFAGRRPELSQIAYVLAQAGLERPVGYVAVHGQRASGKTSVLNMVDDIARDQGYLVARINLVPADDTPATFFAKLCEELVGLVKVPLPGSEVVTPRLFRRIASGGVDAGDLPLEFPEALAQARAGMPLSELALRQDLATFVACAGRPIAVLVDEAQVVAANLDVLSMLRTIGMQLTGFVFVLSGTTELLDRINHVFGQLLRQFEFVRIERFEEREEVRDCVTLPLESVGLLPEACFRGLDELVDDLRAIADGSPYEIQLICHGMFARWQNGSAPRMELSPVLLDELIRTMEARRSPREHALVDKVKELSADQLRALNVLCSGLGSATLKQAEFAHLLYVNEAMSANDLDAAKNALARDGLFEIADGRVVFPASRFEKIYIRLWTLQKLGVTRHPQLINSMSVRSLLSVQLEHVICDIVRPGSATQITGCPLCMTPESVADRLRDIQALSVDSPSGSEVHHVAHIHDIVAAIGRCGAPSSIDVTEVMLSFGKILVHRWVCSPSESDWNLSNEPEFVRVRDCVRQLGGLIDIARTRYQLPVWRRIEEWLVGSDVNSKRGKVLYHESAFGMAYERGDLDTAAGHLKSAYKLEASWQSANNLAYMLLKSGDGVGAAEWAATALRNDASGDCFALSRFNAAMAAALQGEYDTALTRLARAAKDLEDSDYICVCLLIPVADSGGFNLREEMGALLAKEITAAVAVLNGLVRSAELNPMVGGDEPVGPDGM